MFRYYFERICQVFKNNSIDYSCRTFFNSCEERNYLIGQKNCGKISPSEGKKMKIQCLSWILFLNFDEIKIKFLHKIQCLDFTIFSDQIEKFWSYFEQNFGFGKKKFRGFLNFYSISVFFFPLCRWTNTAIELHRCFKKLVTSRAMLLHSWCRTNPNS